MAVAMLPPLFCPGNAVVRDRQMRRNVKPNPGARAAIDCSNECPAPAFIPSTVSGECCLNEWMDGLPDASISMANHMGGPVLLVRIHTGRPGHDMAPFCHGGKRAMSGPGQSNAALAA